MDTVIHTESTAALGMAHRKDFGKVRHIEIQYLCIKDAVHKKNVAAHHIGTRQNPADMLTTGLRRELLDEHLAFVNGHIRGKRDRSAFKLNGAKGRYINGAITRISFKPRETLFTPMKVAGSPKDVRAVGTTR